MMIRDTAIRKLYPQTFTVNAEVDACDINGNKIDLDESLIALEVEKIKAEIELLKYKSQRAAAYPSIADQLDTIYHNGIDAWKAEIAAVKTEYPKP
jgi:hypothetical protein